MNKVVLREGREWPFPKHTPRGCGGSAPGRRMHSPLTNLESDRYSSDLSLQTPRFLLIGWTLVDEDHGVKLL